MHSSEPPRTIYTTYRNHSRFARIRLVRPAQSLPGRVRRWLRDRGLSVDLAPPAQPFDAVLVVELLANTRELPDTRRGLITILTHYRYALYDLATQALAGAAADRAPTTQPGVASAVSAEPSAEAVSPMEAALAMVSRPTDIGSAVVKYR